MQAKHRKMTDYRCAAKILLFNRPLMMFDVVTAICMCVHISMWVHVCEIMSVCMHSFIINSFLFAVQDFSYMYL